MFRITTDSAGAFLFISIVAFVFVWNCMQIGKQWPDPLPPPDGSKPQPPTL